MSPRAAALPCRTLTCANLRPCALHPQRKPFESSRPRPRYGTSGWDWQRRRQRVIARDGGVCQLRLPGCTNVATTADHVLSPRDGGSDEEANLRASCQTCNETRRRQQAQAGGRVAFFG